MTSLEQINEVLGTNFLDEDIDTIAGLVIQQVGRVPKRGDVIEIGDLVCEIQRADPRQIHILIIQKQPSQEV
jgi:magnesium and cobalt transporter